MVTEVDPVAKALSAKTVATATKAVEDLTFSYYMPKHFWPLVALGAVLILIIAGNVWKWSTEEAITSAHKSGVQAGVEKQEKIEEVKAANAQRKAMQDELHEALKRLSAAGGGRQSVLKDVEVTAKKL